MRSAPHLATVPAAPRADSAVRYLLVAAVALASPPALAAPETYFAMNEDDDATLTVAGLHDDTDFRAIDLDSGLEIGGGMVDRFEARVVPLDGVRRLALTATWGVLAYVGRDCCAVGGTTFLPTSGGHTRVGRQFVIYFPALRADALKIFALSEAEGDVRIRIQDAEGECVAVRSIPNRSAWTAWGLAARSFYTLVAEGGDVIIQHSVPNGVESVPPIDFRDPWQSCDNDVGWDSFLFATHSWRTGSLAIFPYDVASATLWRLSDGVLVWSVGAEVGMAPGEFAYLDGRGLAEWELVAEGPIAVWAGDTEGGDGIEWMGDDQSQNLGEHGVEIWLHGQTHGGAVFANNDMTSLTVDGESHLLDTLEYLDLTPGMMHHVVADDPARPVMAVAGGGNDWNDWGTFLRPFPRFFTDVAAVLCADLDLGVPDCPENGGDTDTDVDSDTDADTDTDTDVPPDAGPDSGGPDLRDANPQPEPPKGGAEGCGCRTARHASTAWLSALVILGLARRRRPS